VVRQVGIQRRVDGVLVIGEQQRVAIRRRLGCELARDNAGGAGAVIDDHLLAEDLAELRAEKPRQEIGRAARRGGRDQTDRAGRIVLRLRAERSERDQSAYKMSHGLGRKIR
jgi:hypothetical protein